MQKIFRIFSKEYVNINQAALLLGCLTFLSQVLALFRDRAIAHFIGPSSTLDAYYAAFRIPDLIFISIASLASITVLIPFLVSKMEGGRVTEKAQKLMSEVFSVFLVAMVLVSSVIFVFMPALVELITPGFDAELQAQVIHLSRIMLLSPILLGLSNLFGTVTQLFQRFFLYSLSPLFYNVGIIVGAVFLYPVLGIEGLVYGVLLGAMMHFIVQFFTSRGCNFRTRFTLSINWREIKQMALTSLPRTLGLSFNSIALIAIIALASYLSPGSISIFNFSFNLQSVPINIIGVSYAVAAFPTLVKSFSDKGKTEFKKHLISTARQIAFWSIPVTFLFIVLRAQIVRVILGSGSFTWDDTRLVAAALAIFAVSVMAQGMVALLSRAYYAVGNTVRPLFINLFSAVSIIIFSFLFLHLYGAYPVLRYFFESLLKVSGIEGTEILMLPLAYSCGVILNFVIHWYFIRKDFMEGTSFITNTFFQSLGAGFFLAVATYGSLNILSPVFGTTTFWGIFLQGFISGIIGILVGAVMLLVLKNQEIRDVIRTLRTKFWKTDVLASPQEEL